MCAQLLFTHAIIYTLKIANLPYYCHEHSIKLTPFCLKHGNFKGE